MGSYLGEIVTILVLIVLNGYFAAAEIALVSARRSALQSLAEQGSTRARTALVLLEDPTRLLSTIQVGITLIGFTTSATAAVTLAEPVRAWLSASGIAGVGRVASGLSVFFVTIVITYFTLVFGELSPKRIGLHNAEKLAMSVARPVSWLATALAPVIWVLGKSTDLVSRLFGIRGEERAGVTEEEIKLLVLQQHSLREEEKRMISEVFELGDTVAREIMVPRVDAAMIEDVLSVGEALSHFTTSGFSRIPVFHDHPDSIIGVVLLKDLLEPIAGGRGAEAVVDVMRTPFFVPETKPILDLLQEMRLSHNHMAIVVDEHGGTAGLVTIEDIVEEVIGEIADEFDPDYRYISSLYPGVWVVDGRLPVEDANEKLGLTLPESEEYDTLAGWVLRELGHIPVAGEHVSVGNAEVQVQAVRRRRIARLRVEVQQAKTAPAAGEGESVD